MNFITAYMVSVPFICGIIPVFYFLRWICKKQKLNFLYGLLSLLIFLIMAMIGEFLGRFLFRDAYYGIGDNPAQIGGLLTAILFSWIIIPFIYFRFKWSMKKNK